MINLQCLCSLMHETFSRLHLVSYSNELNKNAKNGLWEIAKASTSTGILLVCSECAPKCSHTLKIPIFSHPEVISPNATCLSQKAWKCEDCHRRARNQAQPRTVRSNQTQPLTLRSHLPPSSVVSTKSKHSQFQTPASKVRTHSFH